MKTENTDKLDHVCAATMSNLILLTALMIVAFSINCDADAAEELNAEFLAGELQRTLSDPDSTVSIRIAAPRDYVFRFLTTRLDEYAEDAVALEFDHAQSAAPDGLDRGSLRITTMENRQTLVQRFLLVDAPTEFAYHTDMERSTLSAPLRYSITRYRLAAIDSETTELSVAVTYRASSRLLAFFVKRAFNSALQRDFERAADIIARNYRTEAPAAQAVD